MIASGVSKTKLFSLFIVESLRLYWRKLSSRFVFNKLHLRYSDLKITANLQSTKVSDVTISDKLYSGYYEFAGYEIQNKGYSPFLIKTDNIQWLAELNSFDWLRHLRADNSKLSKFHTKALIYDWIKTSHYQANSIAWKPIIVARRLSSWLINADFIISCADENFKRDFFESIIYQHKILRKYSKQARPGITQLKLIIALCYCSLTFSKFNSLFKKDLKKLISSLESHISPEGCHVSRSPKVIFNLVECLLPLKLALSDAQSLNIKIPNEDYLKLNKFIEKMYSVIAFFRHPNGSYSCFNGSSQVSKGDMASILTHYPTKVNTPDYLKYKGYYRLKNKNLFLLMDAGHVPPFEVSENFHAGCNSFEFSSGNNKIIQNCGYSELLDKKSQIALRSTAASSTLSINEKSICEFLKDGHYTDMVGKRITHGPINVISECGEEDGDIWVEASHDAYVKEFKLIHKRKLILSEDGKRLTGRDNIIFNKKAKTKRKSKHNLQSFKVRFHLNYKVRATLSEDKEKVILFLNDNNSWVFKTNMEIDLQKSVNVSETFGIRASKQIIIYGYFDSDQEINWSLTQTAIPLDQAVLNN